MTILRLSRIFAALSSSLIFAGAAQADQPDYHVVSVQPLPGGDKWDYLAFDPQHHHLFIAHGDHADVYDTVQRKLTGHIDHTDGIHGIAFAPEMNLGFTSDGKSNSITVFNLNSLQTVGHVNTGEKPDAILYDQASGQVITANGKGRSLTFIDPKTLTVNTTLALDAKPEFTVADGHGNVYANAEDKNLILQIDSRNKRIIQRFGIAKQCDAPSGLAYDDKLNRLFSVCQNHHMVITDANTGKVLQTLPIGGDPDAAIWDSQRKLAFSANGEDGTLTVIGENNGKYHVQQTVKTAIGARTMAMDNASGVIWLVTAAKTASGHQFELITVAP